MTKRSFGVTVFGALFIVVGLSCLWLHNFSPFSSEHRSAIDNVTFVITNALSLFGVLAGAGLFMLRVLAYRATLLLAVGWVLVSVVMVLTGAPSPIVAIMWL